jgi:hypothetical protein
LYTGDYIPVLLLFVILGEERDLENVLDGLAGKEVAFRFRTLLETPALELGT